MTTSNNTASATLAPDIFWSKFETLDDDERWSAFYSYANFVIDAHRAGLVTRQQVGAALSPAWYADPLRSSPEVSAAADLARELKHGGIESIAVAQDILDELASILDKYR